MTRGLTLIELVITISLAAILGIPIGLLLSEHLNGALQARDAAEAMSLARRELELLDSFNNFCDLALSIVPPQTFDPYLAPYPYALTRTITCQVGGANCTSACAAAPAATDNAVKRIQITVRKRGSPDPLASVVTYRTKYVRFGP